MSSSSKSLTAVPSARPHRPQGTHRRNPQEREILLARFRRSGQSQDRFCRENGIPLSTLRYWLRGERLDGQPLEASFVQLAAPVAAACLPGPRDLAMGTVQIRLPSQIELQVAAGADPAWVGALLRGVLTCSA